MHSPAPGFRSLRRKLLLPLLAVITVIAAAMLGGLYHTSQQQLTEKVRERAELIANLVNYAAENTLHRGEIQRIVTAIGAEPDILEIVVAGGNPARIIASTKNIWLGKLLSELPGEEVADDLEKAIRTHAPHSHFNSEQHLLDFTAPLLLSTAELADRTLAEGAVMVHIDTRPINAAIRQSTIAYFVAFLVTLLILAALGYGLLNGFVLLPIATIGKLVTNRDRADSEDWKYTRTNDEIGMLAQTLLDEMTRADTAIQTLVTQKDELHLSEERYRLIAAYSSDIISRFSTDGIFSYISPASAAVLGYEPDKLLGTSLFELIHPDDRAIAKSKLDTVRTSYQLDTLTCRFRSVEGNDIWMETSLRGLRDKSSLAALQIVGVSRDVSERVAAEGEMRDQAEHTRAILEQMVDGIITIDSSGIIDAVNPAVTRIFGYMPDELIGQNVKMLMPPPYHDNHDSYLRNFQESGVAHVIGVGREVEGRRKDGSQFPMDLAVSEITRQGQPMYVGTARDITERKRVERLKNEFVSAVSHEIRTPMNAILGFTQLLSYDDNITERQKTSLSKVHKAGEHLLNIINDVLDLSRIESGKVTLSMEPVAIGMVLTECRNLTQQQADARNIRLHLDVGNAADACVQVDRTRLRQVVLNFISNAVKYNRPSGDVWISCHSDTAGKIRIAVRDNGPGIALDKQADLFKPFNRLGAECSDVEGTGIGLTITKQLVEMMHGAIGMTSATGAGGGSGTTFWAEFSVVSGARDAANGDANARTPDTLATRDSRQCVLYVEDNPVNLEFVQALCSQFWPNLQLLTATTAEDGLELASAQHLAVILMDINLPGMDGYAALQQLQSDPVLREIPVVAVTANAAQENIERGHAAGFTDYLTKPIDIPRFLSTLDRLLSRVPETTPATTAGARVLLVDDNGVNLEVARGLLEKLGYQVDTATDGRAAVESVEHTRYAAILMDCEMPVLDGYAATSAIRMMEDAERRTPIIALTAHAPEENTEQRAEAGMDDYLAKPLRYDALDKMLRHWIGRTPPKIVAAVASTDGLILDAHATGQLKSLLGAHAAPIVDALLIDLPKQMDLLRAAIEHNDVAAIRTISHTMKGSSSNLGATHFAALSAQLGEIGKSGELQRLPAAYAALTQELQQRVKPALELFKQELLRG